MDENIAKNDFYNFFQKILDFSNPDDTREYLCENFWELRDKENFSVLHRACYLELYPFIKIVLEEIKKKKDETFVKNFVNLQSLMGYTAIHMASYRGNIEIIEILIEYGAIIDIPNYKGLNVLHIASQADHIESIIFFKCNYNMDLKEKDKEGSSPLHWACYSGSEKVVNFLVNLNIDINSCDMSGMTPLHLAVFSEKSKIVKKLIQYGANIEIRDKKGRSPYDIAVEKNKNTIIELLKEADNSCCEISLLKPNVRRIEKNYFNLIFFILIHLLVQISSLFIILPCFDSYKIIFLFFSSFGIVMLLFFILIFSDPGYIKKDTNTTLLELVMNKKNISQYCTTCLIFKEYTTKHCIYCDRCVKDFDHHCYWVNNCIGENNIFRFITFIIIVSLNLCIMAYIAIYGITYEGVVNQDHFFFFAKLNYLYESKIRKIYSSILIIIVICFLIPVVLLLVYNLNNLLKKKKRDLTNTEEQKYLLTTI